MTAKTDNSLTVFTKPWRQPGLDELGKLLAGAGFDGVELAVRPGYQVEPDHAQSALPGAVHILAGHGLKVASIASPMTEAMVRACAAAQVPMIRTMLPIDPQAGYRRSVEAFRESARSLEPALKGTGIRVGVQNHCGNFVGTAHGLMDALEGLAEAFVAVLDLAHTTLSGEPIPYALELAAPRLAMVNLKNAYYIPGKPGERREATWNYRWTGGREGLTNWPAAIREIKRIGFSGPICLTAEYKDASLNGLSEDAALKQVTEDLHFLKSLFLQNS